MIVTIETQHKGNSMRTDITRVEERRQVKHELNSNDLKIALQKAGIVPAHCADLKIYVEIPGGGDYSNMDIAICQDFPLHVEYKESL